MIRLIPVREVVRQQQSPTTIASSVKAKEKHASPEIRLGLRQRRATTLTLTPEHPSTSFSQEVPQESIPQSFIQQHLTPADQYKPLAKIRIQTVSPFITKPFLLPEEQGTCSTINGHGELSKKAQGKQAMAGRSIVKLKHNKQRAFSPIQKLAPLLGSSFLEEEKTVNM